MKVVDFQITENGYRIELASDVCKLFRRAGGTATNLCNGVAAVEVVGDLSASEMLTLPVTVAIDAATDHAVIELNSSDYPILVSPSPSLFFRPILTPVYPTVAPQSNEP